MGKPVWLSSKKQKNKIFWVLVTKQLVPIDFHCMDIFGLNVGLNFNCFSSQIAIIWLQKTWNIVHNFYYYF